LFSLFVMLSLCSWCSSIIVFPVSLCSQLFASFGSNTTASLGLVVGGVVAPVSMGLYCFYFVLFVVSSLCFVLWSEIGWLHCWPILVWFPKSYRLVLFTRKGCVISNVLDSSLDLSSNTSVLGFWLYWCSCVLWFSVAPGLLRSAGLKGSGLPPLQLHLLFRPSPRDCDLDCCSKELLCLLLC
jgi:hypothetical protein